MTKAETIKSYMKKYGLTEQEATDLYNQDNSNYESEEMVEMRKKAKSDRRYEKSDKPRKTKKGERKIDEDKKLILSALNETLQNTFKLETEVLTETKINFVYNNFSYTIMLTKHTKGRKK